MTVTPYLLFRKQFLTEVSENPHFGETSRERQRARSLNALSPAAKEIKAKKLVSLLTGTQFLKSVHSKLKRHQRLAKELIGISKHAAATRPEITKLRNAQKTLRALRARMERLYFKLDPKKWAIPSEFDEVIRMLTICEDKLLRSEEFLVWKLHPSTRKAHYKMRWSLPPLAYDYRRRRSCVFGSFAAISA